MDTFILIFGAFALALVVFAGACAIFAAFTLNRSAEESRAFTDALSKAAQELAQDDANLGEAERARLDAEIGRPGPIPARAAELRGLQPNDRSVESRQEPPGALRSPLATRPPCRFCRRVRGALMNAWKAL